MKYLAILPLFLLAGCLNSIDIQQAKLPDGSTAVSVIASHITPLNDAASFTSYRCTNEVGKQRCESAWNGPEGAPGALSGVAAGLGSTAVQTAAPFLVPRIIQNQQNGDTQ